MSILIAVDHGYYTCKTSNFSFTSGLMELSEKAIVDMKNLAMLQTLDICRLKSST